MIPEEDLINHEMGDLNKPKLDVDERQRRIDEQLRKKEEKIRLAQMQKEQREMEECSFAPQLHKKNKKKPNKLSQNRVPYRETHDHYYPGSGVIEEEHENSYGEE